MVNQFVDEGKVHEPICQIVANFHFVAEFEDESTEVGSEIDQLAKEKQTVVEEYPEIVVLHELLRLDSVQKVVHKIVDDLLEDFTKAFQLNLK